MSSVFTMAKPVFDAIPHGADGQPLEYPVPLFVRNTFLDCQIRPPSLDGFFEERRVSSCPNSRVYEVEDGMNSWIPCIESLHRSKTVGDAPGGLAAVAAAAADVRSECSTTDVSAPSSPSSETSRIARGAARCSGELPQSPERGEKASPVSLARSFIASASKLAPWHRSARPLPGQTPLNPNAQPYCPSRMAPAVTVGPAVPPPLLPAPAIRPPLSALLPPLAPTSAPMQAMLPAPAPVAPQMQAPALPSLGSAQHASGTCKPCAFLHSKGCVSGTSCQFCHICEAGEKKRRQKEKKSFFSSARKLFSGSSSNSGEN